MFLCNYCNVGYILICFKYNILKIVDISCKSRLWIYFSFNRMLLLNIVCFFFWGFGFFVEGRKIYFEVGF